MGTWIFQIYRWNKFYTLAKSTYWFLRLIHTEFLRHVAWSPEGNWAVWWITLRKRCQSHISSCKIAAKPIWSIEMFSDITSSQAMLLFKRNPQLTVFSPPTCPQHKNHLSTRHLHLRLIVTIWQLDFEFLHDTVDASEKSHSQPPEMDIAKKPFSEKSWDVNYHSLNWWVESPNFWLLINVGSFSLQPLRKPACLEPIRCSSRRCRWPLKKRV